MNSTGTRYPYIDLLNILACIGVVMLHSANMYVYNYNGEINFSCIFSILVFSVILWPVDVFFMISGATLIRKENTFRSGNARLFYYNRAKRILIPLIVWNSLYGIKFWIWRDNINYFNAFDAFKKFITFDYNHHFWFFIPLIIIYISLPFISSFALNASKKELRLFIILGFIFISFVEPFFVALHIDELKNLFPWGSKYILFTITGYYISAYNIGAEFRKFLYSLAILSSIILFFAGLFVSMHHMDAHFLYSYTFAPCALTAIGIFTYIMNVNLDKVNPDFLRKWSSLSFGIYLCQWMFFSLKSKVHSTLVNYPLILFPSIYILCITSVYAIKKIPILKKIV